jgi:hypothetical protein
MMRALPALAAAVLVTLVAAPALADAPIRPLAQPRFERIDADDLEEMSEQERRALQERLKIRRTMVQVHQVFAFTAAGAIVGAEVIGLVNQISLARGTPKRAELEPLLGVHRVLVGTALTSYLGAGIMAWTMPKALRLNGGAKPGFDSGKAHVLLSVLHGITMATLMTTGFLMANVVPVGGGAWDGLVVAHEIAGFATAGLVITAAITITTR